MNSRYDGDARRAVGEHRPAADAGRAGVDGDDARHRRRPFDGRFGPLDGAARRRRAGPLGRPPRSLSAVAGVGVDARGRAQLGERLALVAELGQHVAEPEVQRPADEQAAMIGEQVRRSRKNRTKTTAMIAA